MKKEILDKIQKLGGNIDKVRGKSLEDDLLSINFDTVLYPNSKDTPWQITEDTEPINGIADFIHENETLSKQNPQKLYDKIIDKYFCLTEEPYGQMFWTAELFTPFKENTRDFEEWNDDFIDGNEVDLTEIIAFTGNTKPDFIQIFYGYSYPDHYYICLSDPNPENPTVFGTDHEQFFSEVSNEGTLEDFLNTFMSKEDLIKILKNRLEK